jgi:hypothetical protein
LTAAQAKTFLAKIDGVASIVQAAQVFNPPLGFTANDVTADLCCAHPCETLGTCKTLPAQGRLWVHFHYYAGFGGGKPATHEELRAEAEFYFNNPYNVFNGNLRVSLPDGHKLAWEPVPWREVGGVTLYHNQSRSPLYVFLTGGARPLWVPVTREQYLEALIREREADVAKSEKGAPPGAKAALAKMRALMVDSLRAQLDGMSAEERASQAWVAAPNDLNPLVPAGTNEARGVVAFNPEYLDPNRPRTDIQFIVVRLEGIPLEGVKPRIEYCGDIGDMRLWEFVNQVDWQRIADAVEK